MLAFRSVNRPTAPDFRDGWQRHHLIPRQLADHGETATVLHAITRWGFAIDDFRANGILLPATCRESEISGLPIHAGPHPGYNRRVAQHISAIGRTVRHPLIRLARVRLLQAQLRATLTSPASAPVAIDLIDVSIDNDAHRAIDARVRILLDSLADASDSA